MVGKTRLKYLYVHIVCDGEMHVHVHDFCVWAYVHVWMHISLYIL